MQEEVRGRLGAGKLDNAVWRIYADPYTRGALVVLRNADGYRVHAAGPVRPRWLAKLRGTSVVAAAWVRVPGGGEKGTDAVVALLGTAFGSVFSLMCDDKYEKNDVVTTLWSAPNGERIDGLRVEYVAGKFVGTVATTSELYMFSDAVSLEELFASSPTSTSTTSAALVSGVATRKDDNASSFEAPFPSELQFMTGSSGVASRRFVWAAKGGITHAQVSVRRRKGPASGAGSSAVVASVVEKASISWATLKAASGSSVPLACNLSAYHVLVLYPASVYAFNQISGDLTQCINVWSPSGLSPVGSDASPPARSPLSERRYSTPFTVGAGTGNAAGSGQRLTKRRLSVGWEEEPGAKQGLSSPAAGFARDVLADTLWIFTEDGQMAQLTASELEQKEAWNAAKAVGRFDLAMALAPLVSGNAEDDSYVGQTREAVLMAQADHAAAKGDWEAASRLYAKTNKPILTVILDIVQACSSTANELNGVESDAVLVAEVGGAPALVSAKNRILMTRHILEYLVRKLDQMDDAKPTQRTIVATMLVQLYASRISGEVDVDKQAETRKDFGHFLADRHQDLDNATALAILSRHGCFEEAKKLALLAGETLHASDMSTRRGHVQETIELLQDPLIQADEDVFGDLVATLARSLASEAPREIANVLFVSTKCAAGQHLDHIRLVSGFARSARSASNQEHSHEAYASAVEYIHNVLGTPLDSGRERKGEDEVKRLEMAQSKDWHDLVVFLFELHAEFGREQDAERSYEVIVAPEVAKGVNEDLANTIGCMLRSGFHSNCRKLCVSLYQALGLHDAAITLALDLDVDLAEARLSALPAGAVPLKMRRALWCQIAGKSVDPVGVVERSGGILHIEDVLTEMPQFESATERVKTAVASSLVEHKRVAQSAGAATTATLVVTDSLRNDLVRARAWRGGRYLSCGHRIPRTAGAECSLCGSHAISSLDAPFDSGPSVPPTNVL